MTTRRPWVMENVQGSDLARWLTFCGEYFDLAVIRHRYFELSGFYALQPEHAHPTPLQTRNRHRSRTHPRAGGHMTTQTTINHGTYAGYQQERRRRIPTCYECRQANATDSRNYRTNKRVRDRALQRLAELHPQDMQHLYQAELAAAGLT